MILGKTLLNTLSQQIDDVLKPLIPSGTNCALIDFPNHSNSGDSAIWLGESEWLRRNNNPVVFVCDINTYSRDVLAERLSEGIILLHGGGNFGDIWGGHQHFREQVIQDFPNKKIIQLPQTIFFEREANIARNKNILSSHSDFTLLVRDQQSFKFALSEFKVPTFLCPDMAFAIGSIERPCPPQTEILWLSRTDKETLNKPAPQDEPGITRVDWLEEPTTSLQEYGELLSRELKINPENAHSLYTELCSAYNLIAHERFLRGCRILSNGKVVVTDRLHGHILCLLMDIPHVLMDNNYGKVRGFYDVWTNASELTRWADSPEEVVSILLNNSELRSIIEVKCGSLHPLDKLLILLQNSLLSRSGWATAEEKANKLWKSQVKLAKQDILTFISDNQRFILVDEDQIRSELNLKTNTVIPFIGRAESYAGPPPNDEVAIDALEKLQRAKAEFIAFAWPAFWWLDHYTNFAKHLQTNFPCILKNDRLVIFDLRL